MSSVLQSCWFSLFSGYMLSVGLYCLQTIAPIMIIFCLPLSPDFWVAQIFLQIHCFNKGTGFWTFLGIWAIIGFSALQNGPFLHAYFFETLNLSWSTSFVQWSWHLYIQAFSLLKFSKDMPIAYNTPSPKMLNLMPLGCFTAVKTHQNISFHSTPLGLALLRNH